MNVIELPLKAIKPYKRNPRRNDKAVEYVANSIRQFGFKVPIVIDANYEIVCGHTRWKAAKVIGLDSVPCIMADDLNEDQIKAFRLADNKTAEMADWDFDLLEMEFEDIDPALFDLADFGFFNVNDSDEFSDNFTLDDSNHDSVRTMTFTLSPEQEEAVKDALDAVKNDITETFGNPNANGNALYEVVRQWEEQKKSS